MLPEVPKDFPVSLQAWSSFMDALDVRLDRLSRLFLLEPLLELLPRRARSRVLDEVRRAGSGDVDEDRLRSVLDLSDDLHLGVFCLANPLSSSAAGCFHAASRVPVPVLASRVMDLASPEVPPGVRPMVVVFLSDPARAHRASLVARALPELSGPPSPALLRFLVEGVGSLDWFVQVSRLAQASGFVGEAEELYFRLVVDGTRARRAAALAALV